MNHSPNHNSDDRLQKQTKTADNSHHESGGASFNDERSDYGISQQRQDNTMSDSMNNDNMNNDKRRSLTTYNHITYFLYVISYFTAGLLWIVPIVMNYAKRHDANGSWLATHFDWQIKTFWYSIVLFLIGIVIITFALGGFGVSILADSDHIAIGSLLLAGFGFLIMIFTFVWHLYRIVRGWIALTDGRPVP
ncbi:MULTISPECIES: hypothetical protein [unclassified Psychrobacter]|uniref:DUF4870 family protein n=1 Tax=unclassified Psychrobacter TaxID=196806 RepID=UPI001D100CF9|nr:hypothetical protein [Psychrobacter sp. SCQQ22]